MDYIRFRRQPQLIPADDQLSGNLAGRRSTGRSIRKKVSLEETPDDGKLTKRQKNPDLSPSPGSNLGNYETILH